ncbi:MAG TPA: TraR/DksA C4-type zinc finger protein [Acidimicrobiia bacterium]|jgi:DnaK suppressor protein|nr:TraR/DksA C4-type zinc finger protein [Acidimicrobiia bacterium]
MDTQEARAKLEAERDRLVALRDRQEASAGLDDTLAEATGTLSNVDQHPGDVGSETFERTKELAVEDQIDERLADVDDALARIERGEFGRCEVCRREIDAERLQARPDARYCKEHQQEADDAASNERDLGER